jgi:hypothetical protein
MQRQNLFFGFDDSVMDNDSCWCVRQSRERRPDHILWLHFIADFWKDEKWKHKMHESMLLILRGIFKIRFPAECIASRSIST